jgi:hypothetical protein
MNRSRMAARTAALAVALLAVACQDMPTTLAAPEDALAAKGGHAPQDVSAWFALSAPEVLALPRTVFADHDQERNRLVFGVENAGVAKAVHNVMAAMQVPVSAYDIQVTEPIYFMSTLRDRHRPTLGGLQIHFGNYVCTLGFNVDHAGGRSFITNSHCTANQGSTGSTAYYQPLSSVDSNPIAIEADDPAYFRGGACPAGRRCRYSDASRALYAAGVENLGSIAKTQSMNTGNLTVAGEFNITSQDNSSTTFSGEIQKVGRTTGWTSGNVTNTCATVNVGGTNITLLCQTLVQRSGSVIVQGGDSGSPVFTGSTNVTLRGILWGGSSGGDLFVFSPLKNVQDELGSFDATTDGVGGGGDPEIPDDPDDPGDDPPCIPRGPNGNNCK